MTAATFFIAQVALSDSNTMFADNLTELSMNMATYESAAFGVVISLATIELIWFGIKLITGGEDKILAPLVSKLILITIIAFMTLNWGSIAGQIRGYVAGGTSMSANPAGIAQQGIAKVSHIFSPDGLQEHGSIYESRRAATRERSESTPAPRPASNKDLGYVDQMKEDLKHDIKEEFNSTLTDIMDTGEDMIMSMLLAGTVMVLSLGIVLCHFYIAIMVYVATIEFYVIVTLTACFIPFGINKHTSFVVNSAFNAVIASSVKLGTMLLLIDMMNPLVADMAMSIDVTIEELLSMLFAVLIHCFVVSRAPAVASQAFTGGGSGIDVASTMSAATTALASTAGALAVRGPMAASKAASSISQNASKAAGLVNQGAHKAIQGAGKVFQGAGSVMRSLRAGSGKTSASPKGPLAKTPKPPGSSSKSHTPPAGKGKA